VDRCDDTCPQADPNACGGEETIMRKVLVLPDQYGMQCPIMKRKMKCGQKKCPVNCVMSKFSGWSDCTKVCGGGVKQQTRSILTQPKNGGNTCDNVMDSKSCNTGTCNRNCELSDWTAWSPCSVACDGGFTQRVRKVILPTRARGFCPKENSGDRLEEKSCNTQACMPDQMCIAKQDLVLMIDGSGSLKEEGFDIVKAFAANLTGKYNAEYFGEDAMKVGVVLFGNGGLSTAPDGSTVINKALGIQPLTFDLASVKAAIEGMEWQRGFTNMAQGFVEAGVMLSQGGRDDAQSAVLVISDGKFTMKYQTSEKANELKDQNIMIFMAPITDTQGDFLDDLKDWASQPWETNYEHIPGLAALKYNPGIFAEKVVAKFCPDSVSPTLMRQKEAIKQYMLIHEDGFPSDECGQYHWLGYLGNKDDCAAKARELGQEAFSYGKVHADGYCYSEAIQVTEEQWQLWSQNRTDVPCPEGTWLNNPYYDVFAIEPASVI